jgi:hypothetical protein
MDLLARFRAAGNGESLSFSIRTTLGTEHGKYSAGKIITALYH